ncbi:uncharacterized protein [Clytia hemisphaerica]|uniref:uncharacterized protein n=1 Tax=Clytia hemisphaerica TaxID=252671 RepID=UPI0034D696A4
MANDTTNNVIGNKFLTGFLIAIVLNFYILHCIVTSMSFAGNEKLFPRSYTEASDLQKVSLTPTHHTYSIWGFNCFLQLAWILFTLISLCNNGTAANILDKKFYGAYMFGIVAISVWLFVWSNLESGTSLAMLIMNQIFLDYAFAFSCLNLRNYLKTNEISDENSTDVWCHRILIQNGILFYATWNFMLCMQNMAIVIHHGLGASDQTSSAVTLTIFILSVFAFFVLENCYFGEYMEYTITFYFGVIWVLGGIFTEVWGENNAIGGVVLGMLLIVCILWVIRCYIVWVKYKVDNSDGELAKKDEKVSLVGKN